MYLINSKSSIIVAVTLFWIIIFKAPIAVAQPSNVEGMKVVFGKIPAISLKWDPVSANVSDSVIIKDTNIADISSYGVYKLVNSGMGRIFVSDNNGNPAFIISYFTKDNFGIASDTNFLIYNDYDLIFKDIHTVLKDFHVSPNPIKSDSKIVVESVINEFYRIDLLDDNKVLIENIFSGNIQNRKEIPLDMSDKSPGWYELLITIRNKSYYYKIKK